MAGSNPLLALVVAAAVAGCAAVEPGFSPPSLKHNRFKGAFVPPTGGGMTSDGRYSLNDHEAKLDCKKINAIIHVGILQMREAGERHRPSVAAKAARAALSPVATGSSHGIDPDADNARALARLQALNARLAEKKCALYDLDSELKPGNSESPAPVKPGRAK